MHPGSPCVVDETRHTLPVLHPVDEGRRDVGLTTGVPEEDQLPYRLSFVLRRETEYLVCPTTPLPVTVFCLC